MRQRAIVIIGIIIILVLAAVSNPGRAKYISFMKDVTLEQCDNIIEKGLVSLLSPTIYDSVTESKNYFFFSIYETKIGEQDTKAIGIFNNFFPLSSKKIPNLKNTTIGA